MMTTQQVAEKLADYCRKGDFEKAQEELYADNVVSHESMPGPDYAAETKGAHAVRQKIRKFMNSIETSHGNKVSEPLVTTSAIAFVLTMDVTMKGKPRGSFSEICIYQVKDGKVISEQFFS